MADDGGAAVTARVRLVDLPVRLFVAAEGQWRGLLREYLLRGFGGEVQAYGPEDVARAGHALDALASVVLPLDGRPERVAGANVDFGMHAVTPGDFALLQAVLDDAVQLSRDQKLLVLPPLPEVIALRNWLCGEAVTQAVGASPTPWRLHGVGSQPDATPAVWDPSIEPAEDVCWLIGDDRNRIVAASEPVLDLLGWERHQLVGQRLLAVIPPAFREAHLASFTRAVVEGGGSMLGRPLSLAALASDGTTVPVTVTLTRHRAEAGRSVFLGVLQPREDPSTN